VEPHILEFAGFGKTRCKRVLEVGCGIGTDAVSFAKCGAIVRAMDVSEKSLDLARQNAEHNKVSINFLQADAEEIAPLPGHFYDVIYAYGSLHHTPNPARALQNLRSLLHAAGELRVMLYSSTSYKVFWAMHEARDWRMTKREENYQNRSEAQRGCPLTLSYTLTEAQDLMKAFHIRSMEKRHIFIWDIDEYKAGNLVPDKAWEGVSPEKIRELERELGQHILIRATIA
jgi:SAM-dependent methyltransferase